MLEPFPIICYKCRQIIWINPEFYRWNSKETFDDVCSNCDYPKFYSFWDFAGSNRKKEIVLYNFRVIDFLIAQDLRILDVKPEPLKR